MLLPLAEARLLGLDLVGELLAQLLFLLAELRVVELLDLGLAELASLHLLLAIVLIMSLLSRRDEIKHMSSNQQRPEFAEVAVILILNCR